jgi:hypothetical protein
MRHVYLELHSVFASHLSFYSRFFFSTSLSPSFSICPKSLLTVYPPMSNRRTIPFGARNNSRARSSRPATRSGPRRVYGRPRSGAPPASRRRMRSQSVFWSDPLIPPPVYNLPTFVSGGPSSGMSTMPVQPHAAPPAPIASASGSRGRRGPGGRSQASRPAAAASHTKKAANLAVQNSEARGAAAALVRTFPGMVPPMITPNGAQETIPEPRTARKSVFNVTVNTVPNSTATSNSALVIIAPHMNTKVRLGRDYTAAAGSLIWLDLGDTNGGAAGTSTADPLYSSLSSLVNNYSVTGMCARITNVTTELDLGGEMVWLNTRESSYVASTTSHAVLKQKPNAQICGAGNHNTTCFTWLPQYEFGWILIGDTPNTSGGYATPDIFLSILAPLPQQFNIEITTHYTILPVDSALNLIPTDSRPLDIEAYDKALTKIAPPDSNTAVPHTIEEEQSLFDAAVNLLGAPVQSLLSNAASSMLSSAASALFGHDRVIQIARVIEGFTASDCKLLDEMANAGHVPRSLAASIQSLTAFRIRVRADGAYAIHDARSNQISSYEPQVLASWDSFDPPSRLASPSDGPGRFSADAFVTVPRVPS